MTTPHPPRLGLALGSGSARGLAYIGVIPALEKTGIRPDVVCGTSVGALVGAVYAASSMPSRSGCSDCGSATWSG
jgi:NTE family protein